MANLMTTTTTMTSTTNGFTGGNNINDFQNITYTTIIPTQPLHHQLILLTLLASTSFLTAFGCILWICYRLAFWRRYYRRMPTNNGNLMLIVNLLLAEIIQSFGFVLSIWWLINGEIDTKSEKCATQALFLNIGNVASGAFTFGIGLHTWYIVYARRNVGAAGIAACCAAVWTMCVVMSFAPEHFVSGGIGYFGVNAAWVCFFPHSSSPPQLFRN